MCLITIVGIYICTALNGSTRYHMQFAFSFFMTARQIKVAYFYSKSIAEKGSVSLHLCVHAYVCPVADLHKQQTVQTQRCNKFSFCLDYIATNKKAQTGWLACISCVSFVDI